MKHRVSYSNALKSFEADQAESRIVPVEEFFTDPFYLGDRVNVDRFQNQLTIIKSFYDRPLAQSEVDLLTRWRNEGKTNWEANKEYSTLVLVVGQRSGKSFIIAGCCCYEAHVWMETEDPWTTFPRTPIARGAPIEIKMVATSQDNARDHVFAEARAFVERSPYFAGKFDIDKRSKKMEIDLPKNLKMIAGSSTAKGIRGGTNLCVGLDELSWMIPTSTAVGGMEIWKALRNTTTTLNGHKFIITSPCTEDDQAMQLLHSALSGVSSRTLVFHLSTFELDQTQSMSDQEMRDIRLTDPEGFNRDYMAIPATAKEPFLAMPNWIDDIFTLAPPGGLTAPGLSTLIEDEKQYNYTMMTYILSENYPVIRKAKYVLAGDPAEKNDAFGFCLLHRTPDGEHIDVDFIGRFLPNPKTGLEVDAVEVKAQLVALCRKFNPVYVSDMFGFTELRQSVRNTGVKVKDVRLDLERANNAKQGIYCPGRWGKEDKRYDGRHLRCWRYPQLEKELKGMELVNGRRVEYERRSGQVGHGDMAVALMHGVAELYDPRTGTGKVTSIRMGIGTHEGTKEGVRL